MTYINARLVGLLFFVVAQAPSYVVACDFSETKRSNSSSCDDMDECMNGCHDLFERYKQRCREKVNTLPERQNRRPGDETTKSVSYYVKKYQEKFERECTKHLNGNRKPSNKEPYTNKWKFDDWW